MPRSKQSKRSAAVAVSTVSKQVIQSTAIVSTSRRRTLAGPSQLLPKGNKDSFSPIVVLNSNVMYKVKKGLSEAASAQSKTKAKRLSTSPKKPGVKGAGKEMKSTKSSPKSKSLRSPRKPAGGTSSPKHASPKRKRSVSPKLSPESPSHSYYLRSVHTTPELLSKSTTKSSARPAQKSTKRTTSPAGKKQQRISQSDKKRKPKLPPAPKFETPVKPKKRKFSEVENVDDESPSSSKRGRRSMSVKKTKVQKTKDAVDVVDGTPIFTSITKKVVASQNSVTHKSKDLLADQRNSTPARPLLAENSVSMNWDMSGIKSALLASLSRPIMSSPEDHSQKTPRTSALSSSKRVSTQQHNSSGRRRSVRFLNNGKAGTAQQLKTASARKRLCYRLCQYLLLLGLPAAVGVGSLLVVYGLI